VEVFVSTRRLLGSPPYLMELDARHRSRVAVLQFVRRERGNSPLLIGSDLVRECTGLKMKDGNPLRSRPAPHRSGSPNTATSADGQRYAPPPPAIGIRTVQPMFVYDVISRRPISTNMLARTGSRKRSEMRAAT
jgi:hypothetical protein